MPFGQWLPCPDDLWEALDDAKLPGLSYWCYAEPADHAEGEVTRACDLRLIHALLAAGVQPFQIGEDPIATALAPMVQEIDWGESYGTPWDATVFHERLRLLRDRLTEEVVESVVVGLATFDAARGAHAGEWCDGLVEMDENGHMWLHADVLLRVIRMLPGATGSFRWRALHQAKRRLALPAPAVAESGPCRFWVMRGWSDPGVALLFIETPSSRCC